MATIAMVGMEIIARLMATTVKVATTAAARLMEITARHMGMAVSYTHLDVYKRQTSILMGTGLMRSYCERGV